MRRLTIPLLRPAVLGLAYFAAAAAAVSLTRFEGGVAFIWIAASFLIAELSLIPHRQWGPPLVACGVASVAATSLFGMGPTAALPLAAINLFEAIAAAALLRRFVGPGAYFDSLRGLAAFTLIAGVIAPALSGLPAAAFAARLSDAGYWSNWLRWSIGHGLGAITCTPLALFLANGEARGWLRSLGRERAREAALHLAVMAAVSLLVFGNDDMPLLFLPVLPLMITTFRTGRLGAAASIVILLAIGGTMTAGGHGPVTLIDAGGAQAQFLQFYLATCVAIALPIAVELKHRQRLMESLRDSETRYRLIAENSSDVIFKLGVDGEVLYASPSIRQLGGYEPDSLIGARIQDLVHADDRDEVIAVHRRALARPDATFIVQYRAKTVSGALIWLETHTRSVVGDSGDVIGVISSIRDIGHRKTLELKLLHAANTDPLTGIGNRRAFNDALETRIRENVGRASGCVAIFDIDHFKTINDRFGHETGDAVIRSFADTIDAMLAKHDVVARLGGEEFGVLLADMDLDQAQELCEQIREATEALLVTPSRASVTVSAGIAPIDGSSSLSMIMRAADEALYRAKAAGRNCLKRAA